MSNFISVGDSVLWRGCWGSQAPEIVRVDRIEECAHRRMKDGREVSCIPVDRKDFGVFDLSNGSWAYGEQIEPIVEVLL